MVSRNFDKNAIFGYLTAKRLYPNYAYFSKKFNIGNSTVLETYLKELKIKISNTNYSLDFNLLKKQVDAITPIPENYETVLVSSALDACGAIYELANYMEDGDSEHIESISTFATDTVDMYIQELLDLDMNLPDSEEKITTHPLMIKEKRIQNEIWNYLNKASELEEEDLNTLEKLQFNDDRGNLDLPL